MITGTKFEKERILIWGKTYPELSKKYTETVCTGGVRADGRPIRLYPVPLRYLEGESQYHLYDIVEVNVTKSLHDPRPESFRIDASSLTQVGNVAPDVQEWAARRDWIMKNPSWHFGNMDQLLDAQRRGAASIGFLQPGEISDVVLKQKPGNARTEHEEKWKSLTEQPDLFPREYKDLEFIPVEIRLRWRCADRCKTCKQSVHDMMVLDWGLIELGRREQDWNKARERLASIANLETHDFRLFLGNFFLHQGNFGIIGLWYPKRRAQMNLTF